ncbi:MAG: hypothetical protein M3N41_05325 [Acidobacteriota bacterium]|nr:hypothetical protein [Acidobacteriota bacterium]
MPETARIEGQFLRWELPRFPNGNYDDRLSSTVRPTDRSVLAFSRLKNEEAVCSYATRYGIFWAVEIRQEHQRERDLVLEADGTVWRLGDIRSRAFADVGQTHLSGKEPLALWFSLSARLRAILRVNAALKGRSRNPLPSTGTPEDWTALGAPIPEDPRDAQFNLLQAVNWWLRIGGVRLELGITEFSRERTGWKLNVAYDGLAGGIAYRLLLMVIGESKLYACDGCGYPYVRDQQRAPRPGQENFCPDCPNAAQKRATERYRIAHRLEKLAVGPGAHAKVEGKRKSVKKTRTK